MLPHQVNFYRKLYEGQKKRTCALSFIKALYLSIDRQTNGAFFRKCFALTYGLLTSRRFVIYCDEDYRFMPFCKVGTKWALVSGAVISLVFGMWMRVCIIAQVGVANSSALYGSFAFLPIVLAWIYISWQIILFGSVLSCQLQAVFSGSFMLPVR